MSPDEDDVWQNLKDCHADYDGDDDAWRKDAEEKYGDDYDVESICDEIEAVEREQRDFYEGEELSDPDNPLGFRD